MKYPFLSMARLAVLLALAPADISLATANAGEAFTNRPASPAAGWVVTNSMPTTNEVTFEWFLNEVARENLDYAAQRYNADLARVAVAMAKEFPNPSLSLGGSKDARNWGRRLADENGRLVSQRMPEPASVGIDQPIEFFGKRKWRVRAAEHNYRAAAATLEDYLRNLKFDASAAYAEALATQRTLEQQRRAADYVRQLVEAQQRRLGAGDIGEVDVAQSRVDELQLQNSLLNAQNDAQVAQVALCNFVGRQFGQATFVVHGRLELERRRFQPGELLARALGERSDLVALRHARDAAQSGVHLAKASRVPDVDVGVSYSYTSGSANFVAPAQPDSMVGVSLSIPLPLWNRQEEEIENARLLSRQAEKTLAAAELKTEVQVRQSFGTYELMSERVRKFRGELLKDADDVLAAKRFGYEHGQTSLLDLLDAQRADNDVHQSYNDALADAAKALIELERAAQLWDLAF